MASGVGFTGYCLKGTNQQLNGELCTDDSHCKSGVCKDWPGAGIANERYCLGMEQDICANLDGSQVLIPIGLDSTQPARHQPGQRGPRPVQLSQRLLLLGHRRLDRPAMGWQRWRLQALRATSHARIPAARIRTAQVATATAAPASSAVP